MSVLSLCIGMGLLDRAFMDEGFDVQPGCEIDPEMANMYQALCGKWRTAKTISELLMYLEPGIWDGLLGGPPCQAHTKLRAMRKPKFPDLTPRVNDVLEVMQPKWYLFENVAPIDIPGAQHIRLDAMHFHKPHQSRPRWFTFSENIEPPKPVYRGNVNDLLAYSIVAGRIYGPKRGAVLQGYPEASKLKFPCVQLQKGLANAVSYPLAKAWAQQVKRRAVR